MSLNKVNLVLEKGAYISIDYVPLNEKYTRVDIVVVHPLDRLEKQS